MISSGHSVVIAPPSFAAASAAPARDRASACRVLAAPARLVLIDIARALAVLMMLQGHTLHAVLSNDVITGVWFRAWLFLRGQTSCLFFLLSGFAFTLATFRHWADHLRSRTAIARRLRKFGFFLLLGYALHSPGQLAYLYWLNEEGWRSLLAVDVLQCLAVILIVLQVLVLVVCTPGRHALAAGGSSLLAHVSGGVGRPGFIVRGLAQESLMIYAVHLCLVYRSPWNVGLYQLVGPTLPVLPALGCVLALWVVTALFACGWHWCKHSRPQAALWVRVGIAGLLVGRLL